MHIYAIQAFLHNIQVFCRDFYRKYTEERNKVEF